MTGSEFDVVIVGAGPAGMAAAWTATRSGCRVAVLDDNPAAGGQIWRGLSGGLWFERLASSGAMLITGCPVIGFPGPRLLATGSADIGYKRLILCTGARELFLPFPGWTLPGVFGAGGLQAMVKGGLPIRGRRVVVAGSGPLLLAVADYLSERGADVRLIAEQASARRVRRLALRLWREPRKLMEGIALRWRLRGTPYFTDSWPVAAIGRERVEAVDLLIDGSPHRVECDFLACGFGLVPNNELAALAGCDLDERGHVKVNSAQETSQPGVYCAGEPVGIGGLDTALIEGAIAGYAAAGIDAEAEALRSRRDEAHRWRAELGETFALRDEVKRLADAGTMVCRCEEVTLGELRVHQSWRAAKLLTRCGMGPCQGRICGPALEQLLGWPGRTLAVRPPLFPVSAEMLAAVVPERTGDL